MFRSHPVLSLLALSLACAAPALAQAPVFKVHQTPGGGALLGYTVFVGGLNAEADRPVRKPDDFLWVDGDVANYDAMSAKEKNRYVKAYLKDMD